MLPVEFQEPNSKIHAVPGRQVYCEMCKTDQFHAGAKSRKLSHLLHMTNSSHLANKQVLNRVCLQLHIDTRASAREFEELTSGLSQNVWIRCLDRTRWALGTPQLTKVFACVVNAFTVPIKMVQNQIEGSGGVKYITYELGNMFNHAISGLKCCESPDE